MKSFIWYFYKPQELNFNSEFSNSYIARAFYLATYINYNNQLDYNIKNIKVILSLSETDFKTTMKKLINYNIVQNTNNKYEINKLIFYKGFLKSIFNKINLDNMKRIKINTDEVRFVYKSCERSRQHKIIGYIFKLIPYCIGTQNIISINNHNADWKDICQIINYDIKNLNRFKDEINYYKLSDGSNVLLQADNAIMINNKIISREIVVKEYPIDLDNIQLNINKIRSNNDEKIINYLIKVKNTNYYKIGCTSDINKRFLCLQTATPFDLEIVHTFKGGYKTEYYLQQVFKKYQIKNEWFELSENYVELIKNLI